MEVEVKLFATFRKGRWKSKKLWFDIDINIRVVLEILDIKEEALGIALVNGSHSNIEKILKNGDVLALFPPIGGG